jgi:predicted permease
VRTLLLPEIAWPEAAVGGRVLGVIGALALFGGLAAGVIPALQASRVDVVETLKGGSSRISPASRTRNALVALQVALSVVLLVASGLFVRSLHRVSTMDLGLELDHVLFVSPEFEKGASDEQETAFVRGALARLKTLPGVEHATVDMSAPFWSAMSLSLRVPGLDSVPTLPTGEPTIHAVDEDYFATLGLRIVRGRGLQATDNRPGAAPVAVVNETMARVVWPRQEAIGRCMVIGDDDDDEPGEPLCATVVGVVENARRSSLIEEETMQYYFPIEQGTVEYGTPDLLLRTRGDPGAMIPVVQRALLEAGPGLRFPKVQPLQDLIEPEIRPWKLGATAFTAFGVLALLVAGVGLYSVLAFTMAQRTFELGIRAALGATGQRLRGMVLWESLKVVAIGLVLGLAIAMAVAPRIEPLLYGVSPRDPVTLGGVALALLLVGALAATIPARRATSIDPSAAFRAE